jgi:translation initiation factor eIF-2B subunit alpha
MASTSPSFKRTTADPSFSIVATYRRLLAEDPDLTMPVAAIEALILLLQQSQATTVFETLDLLAHESNHLKAHVPNPISLSAGTDLFQRYMISSLKTSGESNFDAVRQHLLANGRLFVSRAKAAREKIASYGKNFIKDGCTVLTHGGSRVVGTLLAKAAETSKTGGTVRFKVIYVINDARVTESRAVVARLRSKGVPVATIHEGAIAYSMGKVDLILVGAEGVVENGGIISRMGTYQIGLLAKAAQKPFYVVAESHKFVRLYPLGQYDLPIEQNVIDFRTEEDQDKMERAGDYFSPNVEEKGPLWELLKTQTPDAVDFTPPELVSALITETGVLTPSAVSEELINVYF